MSSTNLGHASNQEAVLAVVDRAGPGSHLSAQEIWLRARTLRPRIGFATVHRALARLLEAGAVMKIDVPGGPAAVYEPPADSHAHFRCTTCGRIDDLAFALPPETRAHLTARYGIAIEHETVTLSGRCARCSPEAAAVV